MIAPDLEPLAVAVDELVFLPGNPRRGDVDAIARSLERFGQLKPVVAKADGTVVAGNHTLAAARQLGWTHIAAVRAELDDATAKAFALADNRTAELGGYDDVDLAALLAEVHDIDPALFADTGWTTEDLERLVGTDNTPVDASSDEIPAWAPAKTAPGDVWLLGPHRVICGDCREPTDVDRLLAGATVNLAFTSPPYAQQRDYDPESGFTPIPPDEYVEWFTMVQANVAAHLADDGSWFVNIKASTTPDGLDTLTYVLDLVLSHVRVWGWHWATEFCWERPGVPKSVSRRFKNQFEPVYQFTRGLWKMRPDNVRHRSEFAVAPTGPGVGNTSWADPDSNTVSQGCHGDMFDDRRGDGWAYPGNRIPTFAGTHEATGHTAAFPVGLPQWFVKAYTDQGDTVYDPFLGSGSTLLAAHTEDRVAYGCEISPKYVDVICKRWQLATGIKPIAESTGNEHDFCEDDG